MVAAREGVDLDALCEVMGAGSGGSAMLALKGGPMREHDFTTLFKLEHMLKDVRLCFEEGEAAGAPFPFAALTREILSASMGLGHGDDDFAAMIEAIEAAAGTRPASLNTTMPATRPKRRSPHRSYTGVTTSNT